MTAPKNKKMKISVKDLHPEGKDADEILNNSLKESESMLTDSFN